jgi:predicted nucleic acid-binding protein
LTEAILLDNSAWSRFGHPSLPAARAHEIADAFEQGKLIVSLPFLLQAGYSARGGREHAQLLEELQALPHVTIDEEVERHALEAQALLAQTGHHRLPPVDFIIAALAHRHGLGLLHYDTDFEHILERTSLRFESVWLAERGSL